MGTGDVEKSASGTGAAGDARVTESAPPLATVHDPHASYRQCHQKTWLDLRGEKRGWTEGELELLGQSLDLGEDRRVLGEGGEGVEERRNEVRVERDQDELEGEANWRFHRGQPSPRETCEEERTRMKSIKYSTMLSMPSLPTRWMIQMIPARTGSSRPRDKKNPVRKRARQRREPDPL